MSCDNFPVWPVCPGTAVVVRAPASCVCPPSPIPPWHRAVKTSLAQTLQVAGAISLAVDTTYLDQTLNNPPAPVEIVIPDGNYEGQKKQIYIRSDRLAKTETWNLAGTFAGVSGLSFDGVGFSAVLSWDGVAWVMIGGNANTL